MTTLSQGYYRIPSDLNDALDALMPTEADAVSHMQTVGNNPLTAEALTNMLDWYIWDVWDSGGIDFRTYDSLLAKHGLFSKEQGLKLFNRTGRALKLAALGVMIDLQIEQLDVAITANELLATEAEQEWQALTTPQKDMIRNIFNVATDYGNPALTEERVMLKGIRTDKTTERAPLPVLPA